LNDYHHLFIYCYKFQQISDPTNPDVLSEKTRRIGVVVCRSTAVMLICPNEGVEEIQNPWMAQEEDEGAVLPGAEETE
jgi:hypothetical protein